MFAARQELGYVLRFVALTCVLFALSVTVVNAQKNLDTDFTATVDVESAFARILPDFEAEASASVFQNERVEVVGRNLNGLWLEIRRPGRLNRLGWIFHDLLEYEFKPEFLPLTDLSTGILGPSVLTVAPDFGAYTIAEVTLRDSPSRRGERIVNVPPLLTIPVLERNADGSWLRVYYLGYEGWVAGFLVRRLPNVMDIPEAVGIALPDTPPVVVIPVEIQQAQIDRLRLFINERRELAYRLEQFWWSVFKGEIMPCNAPIEITQYPYSDQDVRELPELGRYAPQLAEAVRYMNEAREPLLTCGVISPETVYEARNAAINAKVIFDANTQRLLVLEREVVQFRRPRQQTTPVAP